jgi:hypothetical protein
MNYSVKEISLNNKENINMILSRFIPIPEIRTKIIKLKDIKENEETLQYHIERWDNIVGSYYFAKDTRKNKLSYVVDAGSISQRFIIKRDHRLEFFNRTGISYQIIALLHELICLMGENWELQLTPYIDNSYEYWLNHDDLLYSKMCKMISLEMSKFYKT